MVKHQKEVAHTETEKEHPSHRHLYLPHKYVNRKLSYLLLGIGVIFLLFALFFTVKTVLFMLHPPHPISREGNAVIIDSRMTIPYISKAYRIPESELFHAIGLPKNVSRSQSLKVIAERSNQDPEELMTQIRQAITAYQKEHPRPSKKPLP